MSNRLFRNYKFIKDPDEEIIFELRKHELTLILDFFKVFLSLLIFFSMIYFFHSYIFSSWFMICFLGIWFLVTLVYGFYEWTVWYLDLYVLTDKRVVDIEQKTLFSRQVSESSLDKIQDVTFEINGFLATFFNYGNVKIETAGKETVITLDQVKDPEHLQKIIFDAQSAYNKKQKE